MWERVIEPTLLRRAASMTCESELEHLVKYLTAGNRSTEEDLMVMGGN